MKLILTGLLLAIPAVSTAQPSAKRSEAGVHLIPFASQSNHIELQVVNTTSDPLKDVSVEVDEAPGWLLFSETSAGIGALEPGEGQSATFVFDLDEKAPVAEAADLTFSISSAGGILESRTIRIEPEAPTDLTLRGNYPNPFNPTTRIAYALPGDGNVEIEIFNSIGQRVVRLLDRPQEAGYQEATWNAAGFPGGLYFYSVRHTFESNRQVKVGKMVLVK